MKTLYIDINNNPIQETEDVKLLTDGGSLQYAFFYELGSHLVGKVGKSIKKAKLISNFDSQENAEAFHKIITQWNILKSILFGEELEESFNVIIPKEFIAWMSVHVDNEYRSIAAQYDKTKDQIVTIDIESFYEDAVDDDFKRNIVKVLKSDSEISQVVFNDDAVTKHSRIVKSIREKYDVMFIPFEKWNEDEIVLEQKEEFVGKTRVVRFEKQYSEIGIFSCGRCLVKDANSNLYGYIDENGKEVIPCRYRKALQFIKNQAWTLFEYCNYWIVIDLCGQYIMDAKSKGKSDDRLRVDFPLIYDGDNYYYPTGGLVAWENKTSAYYSNGILYISRNGHTRKVDYRDSLPKSKYNLIIKQKEDKYGVTLDDIDSITTIIPFEYKMIEDIHEGFFKLIDNDGNFLICRYF